jgi:hypothetical protein
MNKAGVQRVVAVVVVWWGEVALTIVRVESSQARRKREVKALGHAVLGTQRVASGRTRVLNNVGVSRIAVRTV